jgi:hypothetical protein
MVETAFGLAHNNYKNICFKHHTTSELNYSIPLSLSTTSFQMLLASGNKSKKRPHEKDDTNRQTIISDTISQPLYKKAPREQEGVKGRPTTALKSTTHFHTRPTDVDEPICENLIGTKNPANQITKTAVKKLTWSSLSRIILPFLTESEAEAIHQQTRGNRFSQLLLSQSSHCFLCTAHRSDNIFSFFII